MTDGSLDDFLAEAEDVMVSWTGSADSMNTAALSTPRSLRWVAVAPRTVPVPNLDDWMSFVRTALTDPDIPHYGDPDCALAAALAKLLDEEIRRWYSMSNTDPAHLGVACYVPIMGWCNPHAELTILGIPVHRRPGITWPILGRELERP
jgi:hypothetical protein